MAIRRRTKRSGAYWLSAKRVENAAPGRHADGRGLYLMVQPNAGKRTGKTWVLRYQLNGRRRDMGLGPFPTLSLDEARKRAEQLRLLILDGVDPLEERERNPEVARKKRKFKDAATALIESKASGWKSDKHREQWVRTLEVYAFPLLGDMDVRQIQVDDVLNVLRPIWTEKPETASRVRQRVEAVLDYAAAMEWRRGDNPARWKGRLDHLLPRISKVKAVRHFPALPWQQMGMFMVELRQLEGLGPRALEFTILTACRSGEVLGARWDEVDMTAKTWTIPPERMKGGRVHRVPLSEAAVAVLEALPRVDGNPHVFPGQRKGKSLSSMALAMVLRRMERADITVHGFRSAFRDWCGESTNFPRELAEAALAHVLSDKTESAYQRGDYLKKRRRMMESWAKWCDKPAQAAEVVAMGSKR